MVAPHCCEPWRKLRAFSNGRMVSVLGSRQSLSLLGDSMMKRRFKGCLILSAIGLAASSACAQAQARVTLDVDVTVDTAARHGGTRTVGIRVAVAASSSQQLLSFYLDAPVPVDVDSSHVGADATFGHWMVMDHFADRRVTSWTNARRPVPAGDSTPRFTVSGQGVFGLVRFWTAFYREPVEPDSMPVEKPDSVSAADTTVRANGPGGWTLGIIAPPPLESASAAANRLHNAIATLCALAWVSPSGVCTSLQAKAGVPRERLDALASKLEAQRGKHVSEGAYWILVEAIAHVRTSPHP